MTLTTETRLVQLERVGFVFPDYALFLYDLKAKPLHMGLQGLELRRGRYIVQPWMFGLTTDMPVLEIDLPSKLLIRTGTLCDVVQTKTSTGVWVYTPVSMLAAAQTHCKTLR